MCAQGELVVAIFSPGSFNGARARQCVKLKIYIRHSLFRHHILAVHVYPS